MIIRSDSHTHTCFSTDSDTPVEKMIEKAIDLGLTSLCITDHMDYDFPELGHGVEFIFDPADYMATLQRLAADYPQIVLRRGIEIGLQPHLADRIRELTHAWPFDFVIGSTHVVDGYDPYYPEYWEGKTEQQGLLRYYEETLHNLQAGCDMDVYGHIDYIIRYTPTQQAYRKQQIQNEAYMDQCLKISFELIDEVLKEILAQGKGIELNTAGLKYGLGHAHPHEKILKRYKELGGEIITIGSDGHEPAHLAYDFALVPELLKACGFRYYTEYRDRKPEMIKL